MFVGGGVVGGARSAVVAAAGAQIVFTAATTYTAACAFGADDPTRQVLVLTQTINQSAVDAGPSFVTVDGNAATRIYLFPASGTSNSTVWLVDYPTGASGNVVVGRSGSNFTSGWFGVFTIIHGRDVANYLDLENVLPAEPVPVSKTMTSKRGGVVAGITFSFNADLPLIYSGGMVQELTDSVGAPNNVTVSLATINGITTTTVTPEVTTTPGPPSMLGPFWISVR